MSTQVALVTGASRGIGRAIALGLARRGLHVAINYRSRREAAEAVEAELAAEGLACSLWEADVSDKAATKQMIAGIKAKLGRLDVLVNNAGVLHEGLFFFTPIDKFWEIMQVNLGGVVNCSRYAIPMLGRHKAGRIINMASIAAMHGSAGLSAYASSKGAVISLSKVLARELAKSGVTVNVVAPGLVASDMTDSLASPEAHARSVAMQPVARMGEPDEIARLVVFLACDAPGYLTGEVIRVDGGSMIS
ncbi:3-oxoacyl-[acyl-carrier-protein] reductase FabG [Enhygromyxa salina]|uniref:3-oxoacyl-[acyl-carrier-protein] reductase FabG n=1 Tax=Enhygromyxa salina TaxID=215803 RepID=A0A2S9YL43_9BACT|nr:3-oxoacyl-ACP reductase family protein [Enhygromyxa salina]PRQ05835.1 3-oxoacyl-[acyl-carrier-protein] reductase FabG [Enhygromyxa salina]